MPAGRISRFSRLLLRRDVVAGVEVSFVFLLIMLHIWLLRLAGYRRFWWVILGLVVLSHLVRHESAADLGFRRQGFESCWRECTGALTLLLLALLGVGITFQSIRPVTTESAFFSFAFYCLWGLFQQYVLNGYMVNRLQQAGPRQGPNALAWMGATLF